jgi:hypothetical protein
MENFDIRPPEKKRLIESMEEYTEQTGLSQELQNQVQDINKAILGVYSGDVGSISFEKLNPRLKEIYVMYIHKLNEIVKFFLEGGLESYKNPLLVSYINDAWGFTFSRYKNEIEHMENYDVDKFKNEFFLQNRTRAPFISESDVYLSRLGAKLNYNLINKQSPENLVMYILFTINSIVSQVGNAYNSELSWSQRDEATESEVYVAKYAYIRIMRDLVYVTELINKAIPLP